MIRLVSTIILFILCKGVALAADFNAGTYGANGNGTIGGSTGLDNTTPLQNAISACASSGGGGHLVIPAGVYRVTGTLYMPAGQSCDIEGGGSTLLSPSGTIILTDSPSANGIAYLHTALINGGALRNLSFVANGPAYGVNSSGVGIYLKNVQAFIVDHVNVQSFAVGWAMDTVWNSKFTNDGCFYAQYQCLSLTAGGGKFFSNWQISNLSVASAGVNADGVKYLSTGGDYWNGADITSFNRGVVIQPGTGQQVSYLFFNQVLGDSSASTNWLVDGTSGTVVSIVCTNCWAAYSSSGTGVTVQGSNVSDFKWVGGRVRENGSDGVDVLGGTAIAFQDSSISSNGKAGIVGKKRGIYVAPNVSQFTITGNQIGNFASAFSGQENCVFVDSGGSAAFIVNNNLCISPAGGVVKYINGSAASPSSYIFPLGSATGGGNL